MESPETIVLSSLPNKLVFVLSLFHSLLISSGLYASFAILTQNVLLNNVVSAMRCALTVVFVSWVCATMFPWFLDLAPRKSRLRIGYAIKSCFVMVVCVFCLHFLVILFGAALTEDVTETFHLSALACALSLWPCILFSGLNPESWLSIICSFEGAPWTGVEGCIGLASKGALLGMWLGAIPIPLDWDRPWQKWPVTCVIGTLVGYVCGLLFHIFATIVQLTKDRKNKLF